MKLDTGTNSGGGEHWYCPKSGDSRHGADLRQARKEGLYPSVTTILSCKAKPGLENWKIQEAILASLTLPRLDGEDGEAFAARVLADYKSTASKAAGIGTMIHDWAENYCKGTPIAPPAGYEAVCYQVQEWIDDNVAECVAEASMVSPFGYAGRVDLQGTLKTGEYFIADFKTQGIKTGKKPTFYQEWCYQLAAYGEGKVYKLCNIAISSVKENPIVACKWWEHEEIETGWSIFQALLKVWKLERGYHPELFDRE